MRDVKIFEFLWQVVVGRIKRYRKRYGKIYILHETKRTTTPFTRVIKMR